MGDFHTGAGLIYQMDPGQTADVFFAIQLPTGGVPKKGVKAIALRYKIMGPGDIETIDLYNGPTKVQTLTGPFTATDWSTLKLPLGAKTYFPYGLGITVRTKANPGSDTLFFFGGAGVSIVQ
jgi:hypothetical protein